MTDAIQDTTIYIGTIAIHEPVTVLTDYLITIQCLFFFIRLNRFSYTDNCTNYWKCFFGLMALSSFAGGCSHAFFAVHQGAAYKAFWLSMQALNILSVFYMQRGTLYSALKDSTKKKYWNISYHVQLVVFFAAVFIFQNFLVVIINTVISLIPVMLIHFADAKRNRQNLWIAYGIVVLFITAGINAAKLSIHPYFNYLDLAHVLIMLNLLLMYTGVKRKASALQSA
jgi:hypothetical protein